VVSSIRVVLASRHRVFCETLTTSLTEDPRLRSAIEIVARAADLDEALGLLERHEVDLVLLDALLDRAPVYPRMRRLRDVRPGLGVLLLGIESEEGVVDGLEAGALGALPRNATLADLRRSIEAAVAGDVACSQEVQQGLRERLVVYARRDREPPGEPEDPQLTPRELEILRHLHLSNQEIGDRLFIALATVKVHVHRILKKLRVKNRRAAIRTSRAMGLLDGS